MTVEKAESILKDAIVRMPVEVTGWPKHILDEGTDADKIGLAKLLQRGDK